MTEFAKFLFSIGPMALLFTLVFFPSGEPIPTKFYQEIFGEFPADILGYGFGYLCLIYPLIERIFRANKKKKE